jgi:hypothetical protein
MSSSIATLPIREGAGERSIAGVFCGSCQPEAMSSRASTRHQGGQTPVDGKIAIGEQALSGSGCAQYVGSFVSRCETSVAKLLVILPFRIGHVETLEPASPGPIFGRVFRWICSYSRTRAFFSLGKEPEPLGIARQRLPRYLAWFSMLRHMSSADCQHLLPGRLRPPMSRLLVK